MVLFFSFEFDSIGLHLLYEQEKHILVSIFSFGVPQTKQSNTGLDLTWGWVNNDRMYILGFYAFDDISFHSLIPPISLAFKL